MGGYLRDDSAQAFLAGFVEETADIFLQMLSTLDQHSTCQVLPTLDLGFPHDAMRLAGGFPTGTAISWNCSVPVVPVDTTVNVCTASIYKLPTSAAELLTEERLVASMKRLEASSYKLNFHRGNHFISLTAEEGSEDNYLILHSSAAEFKHQFNGLYPVEGNWYHRYIQTYRYGKRYIRFIQGHVAEAFTRLALTLPAFNEQRHEFIAMSLLDHAIPNLMPNHFHHYCMPSNQSVLIGSYLAREGEVVPIFTRPGLPIYMFEVGRSETNAVNLDGKHGYLVPHGWGKGCGDRTVNLELDPVKMRMTLNGQSYGLGIEDSLRDHPDLKLRDFGITPGSENYYFDRIAPYVAGRAVRKLNQVISYSKGGVTRWQN